MFELSIKESISSAHFLKGYEGKCQHLHGHNYIIEVVVCGNKLDSIGMLADFGILKQKLRTFVSDLDHVCLNDHSAFKEMNPTSENIARFVYQQFSKLIAPLSMKRVQVWESEHCSVIYYE